MRVKNNSGIDDVWCGMSILNGGEYDIQPNELDNWCSDSKVIADLSSLSLLIGDGITYKTTPAEAVNFLLGYSKEVKVLTIPPFSSKSIGTLKLFARVHGIEQVVSSGLNTIDFLVPYNQVKFNGLELIGGAIGDRCDLEILDTPTGAVSTIPYFKLNQFGYSVNIGSAYYKRESSYDADLIKDMTIRVKYTSVSSGTVYINYLLHELKP